MKVLQINTCVTKSTGRIAQQIGEAIMANGGESYIAYAGRNAEYPSNSKLVRIGGKFDSYFHATLSRIFDNQGLLSYFATKKFIKEVECINPDIIHLHNIHGYYLNYPLFFEFLKQTQKPVVWTMHDCWAFTGHCVHYTDVNCFKWQTGCSNCPKKKTYPTSYVFDGSKRNYEKKIQAYANLENLTVVPVSYWLGDVTKKSILGNFNINVIQNGIDVNIFRPRENAYEVKKKYFLQDKYVILGVAVGWSEDVGLSSFVRLRSKLAENFAIVMVGTTPEVAAKLPNGIIAISRTNNVDELAELYSAADILYNGSYQETFGLVTAEAISCGTPAIVYNSTACHEIVTEETGYVAEVKNEDQVLEHILRHSYLRQSEKLAQRQKCRKYAVEYFDKNIKYQEYLDLYNRITYDK